MTYSPERSINRPRGADLPAAADVPAPGREGSRPETREERP
jgi:hypothetical protein